MSIMKPSEKIKTKTKQTESILNISDRKLFEANEKIKALTLALTKAQRDLSKNDAMKDMLQVFRDSERRPPNWVLKTSNEEHGEQVPVVMWADWHLGEVVQGDEVAGFNEYNMDIARERIKHLVSSVSNLCFNHHVSGGYPGIVICLTGDFVSGGIHQELQKTNDLEVLPTVLEAEEILIWAIEQMAEAFGRVYLPCVAGNHGRTTAKPEFKNYYMKNFDWLIYKHLARHFKDDPRVHVDVRPSNDVNFRVYNMRYCLVHGDMLGVKGGDGIIGAVGPIIRGEVKKSGQAQVLNQGFDKLLLGHWHQRLWLPRATVSGTLKGFDEYARLQLGARPDRPTQPLWFVHPIHGETAHWDIYCDGDEEQTSSEWVTFQSNIIKGDYNG